MKLRIHGDSIRLRLRKPDVLLLLETGVVIEPTAFGPGSELRTRLEIGGDAITAGFANGEITVRVPRDVLKSWAAGDQVAMQSEQPAGDGRSLRILIEKDFACKNPGGEESQDGVFENPDHAVC